MYNYRGYKHARDFLPARGSSRAFWQPCSVVSSASMSGVCTKPWRYLGVVRPRSLSGSSTLLSASQTRCHAPRGLLHGRHVWQTIRLVHLLYCLLHQGIHSADCAAPWMYCVVPISLKPTPAAGPNHASVQAVSYLLYCTSAAYSKRLPGQGILRQRTTTTQYQCRCRLQQRYAGARIRIGDW